MWPRNLKRNSDLRSKQLDSDQNRRKQGQFQPNLTISFAPGSGLRYVLYQSSLTSFITGLAETQIDPSPANKHFPEYTNSLIKKKLFFQLLIRISTNRERSFPNWSPQRFPLPLINTCQGLKAVLRCKSTDDEGINNGDRQRQTASGPGRPAPDLSLCAWKLLALIHRPKAKKVSFWPPLFWK